MNKKEATQNVLVLDMPFEEALSRYTKVNVKDLEDNENDYHTAQPFVKWVGGKRSIINELTSRMPKSFNNYFEPFVGGGALFYELNGKVKKAFLSDINLDLVIAYNVIKKEPQKIIDVLKEHAKNHNEEYYYKVRSQHNLQDPIKIAARFLYLNKTGFNGLFRVNKKGEFNVPIGRYTNPNIIQEKNIWQCHSALAKATIEYRTFETIAPQSGDFVYFDPPYHPTDESSFTKYTKLDFTEKDQIKLRDFVVELHKKGVKIMLSNSKTKFIESLFSSSIFTQHTVHAPRYINCKPNKRNSVEELLITNY